MENHFPHGSILENQDSHDSRKSPENVTRDGSLHTPSSSNISHIPFLSPSPFRSPNSSPLHSSMHHSGKFTNSQKTLLERTPSPSPSLLPPPFSFPSSSPLHSLMKRSGKLAVCQSAQPLSGSTRRWGTPDTVVSFSRIVGQSKLATLINNGI